MFDEQLPAKDNKAISLKINEKKVPITERDSPIFDEQFVILFLFF
jgi:hypothetical protein